MFGQNKVRIFFLERKDYFRCNVILDMHTQFVKQSNKQRKMNDQIVFLISVMHNLLLHSLLFIYFKNVYYINHFKN